MPRIPHRAWIGVGTVVVALTALGVTIVGAQTDTTPSGTDSLSPAEVEIAAGLARSTDASEGAGLDGDDVLLLVERHNEDKTAPDTLRRADVYVYSYADDVLTRTLVDLDTGEAVSSQVLPNTQLPLVPEEVDRALALALEDPAFETLLATRYRQATGRDLADPDTDLRLQAMVFRADANPDAADGPAARCGEHRCAQLLIESSDDLLVNLLPIIDLSDGRLIAREGFFS